jgi:hypothetical protein
VIDLQQGGLSNSLGRRHRHRCYLIECPSQGPGRQRRQQRLGSVSLAEIRGAVIGALAALSWPWTRWESDRDRNPRRVLIAKSQPRFISKRREHIVVHEPLPGKLQVIRTSPATRTSILLQAQTAFYLSSLLWPAASLLSVNSY